MAAAPASAATRTLGLNGWQVQTSAKATQSGASISEPGFETGSWLRVRPDSAGAVGTEVEALLQNGRCPHVFYGTNMKKCFGYMKTVGPETIKQFKVPWWFRTRFLASPGGSTHYQLIINGVVGSADVWVNGHQIATSKVVQGDFTRYTFNITGLVHSGANALALRVHANDPNKVLTLDNVDWTQIPPDNNTGLQFPVQLHTSQALALSNAHVMQHDSAHVTNAALTLKADVTNNDASLQTGTVNATITTPSGHSTEISQTVTVPAHSTSAVTFTPGDYPQLLIEHPRVWWPYQMGSQPLYGMRMAITQPGAKADAESESFGIRTVTTRLVGATPGKNSIAPYGSRQFLVNGIPIMFRAGGWSENLFLHYSAQDTAKQIQMIKNLGLNGIRTEGKQMPANFYEQMDRAGILIDGGFQCCDLWDPPSIGAKPSSKDYKVMANSSLTIGQNLRNHPSVMNFSWSDDAPTAQQETVSLAGFKQADFQDPIISSAEYNTAPGLGPSGEKEGPYDWVPPSYWADTSHYVKNDPTRTNVGGAWAFDSEASSGATIPTLDSIRRFMSPEEQRALWKDPNYNQYHLNYENYLPAKSNYGYAFGTLHDLDKAIRARYGNWHNLDQYVEEAQVQNYETQRAQFEAFINNSRNKLAPSTGLVYWQLNKGWPTLLWDLYNYDWDQAGSYFGAQQANLPLHAIYSYANGTVSVDNMNSTTASGLTVQASVYNVAGKRLSTATRHGIRVTASNVDKNLLRPKVPATTLPPQRAQTYFVELNLSRGTKLVDRNVYWLSTQKDQIDWKKTLGNPQATMTRYANLQQLHQLKPASVRVAARSRALAKGESQTTVTVTNTSKNRALAFFLRADLRRGSSAGVPASGDNEVLPVQWSSDDISLWPGQSQTLTATYQSARLDGRQPVVSLSGWNVRARDTAAPLR